MRFYQWYTFFGAMVWLLLTAQMVFTNESLGHIFYGVFWFTFLFGCSDYARLNGGKL